MLSILWTIYLVILLYITYGSILKAIYALKIDEGVNSFDLAQNIIMCIGWSIWYMYFLH